MNYRHAYHVGHSTDVFKHLCLILLLQALHAKDKAFCYLDTHSGLAYYDLLAEEAQKTEEYRQGILKLWEQSHLPDIFTDYMQIISDFNRKIGQNDHNLHYYPGSPTIASYLLRPQDRAICSELQPQVCAELKHFFKSSPQVHVHHMDGYQSLKAFLPVDERRGLVLIDPPYEQANEYEMIIHKVARAYQRASTMIYAIWYPIKNTQLIAKFHQQLQAQGIPKMLVAEFCHLPTDNTQRLNGSGLAIINPPWQIDIKIKELLTVLPRYLDCHNTASNRILWLANQEGK